MNPRKKLLVTKGLLALMFGLGAVSVQAGTTPRIVNVSKTPTLHSGDIRFDAATGNLRGMVYLGRNYETPRLPHVHVYAFGKNGKLLFSGCALLSDDSLRLQPRFNLNPRDAFSIHFPIQYRQFAEVKVVTDSEDRCKDHAETL
jgi:hypothetical protein